MRRDGLSRVGLLQGTLDLLSLRTLLAGPAHGHAVAKQIQRTSQDLPPDAVRAQTARGRAIEVGQLFPRHGLDSESGRSGGAMNSIFRKLRWLIRRPDKDAELREELQFHLEEEAEQRQEDGLAKD